MSDPIVTKKTQRVYQVLDLKQIFGVNLSSSIGLKEDITQALIDEMKDRISEGIDINGKPMKQYSKMYKESDEYIAARKTGVVNMTLTGDMMGSLDVIKDKGNKVTIGFTDRTQELKAHRHMVGNEVPVREFFGITDREIEKVKEEFREEIDNIKKYQRAEEEVIKKIALNDLRKQIYNYPGRDIPIVVESDGQN